MNLRQMAARIATSIARGVLTAVDDEAPTQLVQVETLEGVVSDRVEHFQPWGISFTPPTGAEVVVLAVGGGQEHLIALAATDRDVRPTNAPEGEGGVYDADGWKVYLKPGKLLLGSENANQSFVRGEDMKEAIAEYAKKVTDAVGSIKISGGSDGGTVAQAQLQLLGAQLILDNAIKGALSTKVRGE